MSSELTTEVQPSLFMDIELDLLSIDQPDTRKRYTAASLERCVAKRDAIVRALAEGHGLLRIARVYGVSHHLVSTLRDSRPDLVAIEKKQLSGKLGQILRLSADRYLEALEEGKIKPDQLPVPFGIFSDKKAALDGDAGMIVEHRHKFEASADGYRSRLRAAVDSQSTGNQSISPQKGIVLDAELITDTSNASIAAPAQSVAGQPESPADGRDGGGGDASGTGVVARPMDPINGGETQKEVL